MLIDRIYKTLLFFSNNQLQGNVSPTEFNIALYNRVLERFEDAFYELNKFLNRENRRLVTEGFSNISSKATERISHYLQDAEQDVDATILANEDITYNFVLAPEDCRYIDNMIPSNGVRPFHIAKNNTDFTAIQNHPNTKSSLRYPLALKISGGYRILPKTVEKVVFTYLRTPKKPNWTYTVIPGTNNPLFNPSDNDFEDVDIHPGEETILTLLVLSSFGINLKEKDLVSYTEQNQAKKENQENTV